ncbi:Uncharacterized protein DAT39_021059, partial [Clarias magur]
GVDAFRCVPCVQWLVCVSVWDRSALLSVGLRTRSTERHELSHPSGGGQHGCRLR